MRLSLVVLGCVLCATQVGAHSGHGSKRHDVIAVMQDNGCRMAPELTQATLAKLKIGPNDAVTLIGNLMAEGIVAFAADDRTLLLLPPECKA